MNKKWSSSWISSKQPRKQRKFRANAPIHTKRKFLGANLESKLKDQFKKKSMPLKKDDEIVVKRGKYKSKIGKIVAVQIDKSTVHIEGIKEKKGNGQEYMVPIHASNLQIIKLNLENPRRVDKTIRKKKTIKKPEKKTERKVTSKIKKEEPDKTKNKKN